MPRNLLVRRPHKAMRIDGVLRRLGNGERQLHFIHLPAQCTIKIFNVRGQLIQTLEHDSPLNDGTEIWDMLSRDNLEIAYGIYIYHVEAEGIGEKIGKFVVIK